MGYCRSADKDLPLPTIQDKMVSIQACRVVYQQDSQASWSPVSIVSDRDPRFTSHFWHNFQNAMGTELHMSSAYHLQSDGQSERTIQILEDMLRACCLNWKGNWADYVSLVEFVYNNSYQASIGMAPFEALYDCLCRSSLCWEKVGDRLIQALELVQ